MLDCYDKQTLVDKVKKGFKPSFEFFWGHQPPKDGGVNKSCFSQWYPSPFVVNQISYLTAEHWMMAEKARLFEDETTLQEILVAFEPKDAKALGRKVKNFDDKIWKQQSFDIVCRGNRAKFEQNPSMKAYLLGTESKILVEASPYDRIWGIGLKAEDPKAQIPEKWEGENLLGFALMKVRDEWLVS